MVTAVTLAMATEPACGQRSHDQVGPLPCMNALSSESSDNSLTHFGGPGIKQGVSWQQVADSTLCSQGEGAASHGQCLHVEIRVY